jgi:hypothetical protein
MTCLKFLLYCIFSSCIYCWYSIYIVHLFYFVLFYFVLFYFILFYFILFYFILSSSSCHISYPAVNRLILDEWNVIVCVCVCVSNILPPSKMAATCFLPDHIALQPRKSQNGPLSPWKPQILYFSLITGEQNLTAFSATSPSCHGLLDASWDENFLGTFPAAMPSLLPLF